MRHNHNEMMVHIALCSHKLPQNVLILGDAQRELSKETDKYYEKFEVTTVEQIEDIKLFLETSTPSSYDVIILNDTTIDDDLYTIINTVLKDDGLMVMQTNDLYTQTKQVQSTLKRLGKDFKIIMPYSYLVENEEKTQSAFAILASKLYHPTADVILQRTDMLDNLSYYNSDIHPSAFAMPTKLKLSLRGFAKN